MSKLYIALIAGGRGGDEMRTHTMDLEGYDLNDPDTIEGILSGEINESYNSLTPNQSSDIPKMVEVMKGNEDMFIEWDVFGEGVVGITTNKKLRKELVRKTRAEYDDVCDDNVEWDD